MPTRRRTTTIGVYPRVLGIPFSLGLILIVIIVSSAFIAAATLNVWVFFIPTIPSFIVALRISKKYGDFYLQKMKQKRYERYKSRTFMAKLHYNLLANKYEQ